MFCVLFSFILEIGDVMEGLLVNHTNHPVSTWPPAQRRAAAGIYAQVVDLPAPLVTAECSERELEEMARTRAEEILAMQPTAVLCQGEYCYTYAVVSRLRQAGVTVLAACSERVVEESREEDGSIRRVSRFVFSRFRRYS